MKPTVVFINLLIDSLWSQESFLDKIFEVKGPEAATLARSNEFLGRYFAKSGDLVIVPVEPKLDTTLTADYLNIHNVTWIEVASLLQNRDEFATGVIQKSKARQPVSALFSGPSPLEISIENGLDLRREISKMNLNKVMQWNRKDYLLTLAKVLKIKIPKSEIVTSTQIENSNHLYKSLVSSGGSGVYTFADLEMIKTWSQRKNLMSEWNECKWLKQEIIERKTDINCFGHSDSDRFRAVTITYDKTRLSYRHDFDLSLERSVASSLRETFESIRGHLKNQGYSGYFGFDSIISCTNELFPIVDLNVRMNKSHVLSQVAERIKNRKSYTSFYRIRFLNTEWPEFKECWNAVHNLFKNQLTTDTQIFPVDWSFWNLGKSEFLFAVCTDTPEDCETVGEWAELINKRGTFGD